MDDHHIILNEEEQETVEQESVGGRANESISLFLYLVLAWQAWSFTSDRAIRLLLAITAKLFELFGKFNSSMAAIASTFPSSLFLVRKWLGLRRNDFEKYVNCPKCSAIYDCHDLLYRLERGDKTAGQCCNVIFKKTSKNASRKECKHKLFKKVFLTGGKIKYVPLKTFPYRSLYDTLEALLKRPGFETACREWRNREIRDGFVSDVFDGRVWNDYQTYGDKDFLKEDHCYAFMANLDWFQCYKRRSDVSIGVIYLTLLNLPRELRFKRENTIIVGVMPALGKEPKHVNHYLKPLVEDLKTLWNPGVPIRTHEHPDGITVRAALLAVSCDVPATRKMCGLPGHSAKLGCSKCMKKSEGKIWAGFDKNSWPPRSRSAHVRAIQKLKKCSSQTSYQKMSMEIGYKDTVLLELPYFDTIRMHLIDPMHCLFLGVAKHVWKLWLNHGLLTNSKMKLIENKIKNIQISADSGRVPTKISSNWSKFTAYEWKVWTMVYSMYVLQDILPETDLKIWANFVCACHLICKPYIALTMAKAAEAKLCQFGTQVALRYGNESVPPNMHLAAHLGECIIDYGSVYTFWLFSFERFNGILEETHLNHMNIEVQFMRTFLRDQELYSMRFSQSKDNSRELEELHSLLSMESCYEDAGTKISSLLSLAVYQDIGSCVSIWRQLEMIQLPNGKRDISFDCHELQCLRSMYRTIYPDVQIEGSMLGETGIQFAHLHVGGEHFGSQLYMKSACNRLGSIIASWCTDDGEINTTAPTSFDFRPGRVRYYVSHYVELNGQPVKHILANVDWYEQAHENLTSLYKKPASVWFRKKFVPSRAASFMPVQRLAGKYAWAIINAEDGAHRRNSLQVVCPNHVKIFV